MSMYCFQCQEKAKNQGCTFRGVCGKNEETANLQKFELNLLQQCKIRKKKRIKIEIPESGKKRIDFNLNY